MQWEEILKRRGLVSKGRGGDQSEKTSLRSYASQASEALGVTKRTVEKDLEHAGRADRRYFAGRHDRC